MSATTITPKQQSFVRSLLQERLSVLGIDDIDKYIEEKGINKLTAKSASEIIDKLKSIPAPRNPEHAHLPEGRVIVNKFAKECALCNRKVDTGAGFAVQANYGWRTYHAKGDCLYEADALETVDRGYYAIPSLTGNNDLDFFFVHLKNGKKEVLRVLGGQAPFRVSDAETKRIVEALVSLSTDELTEAQARYGRELGVCGKCGRHLTDEASRARGLGSECAKK
jgi:hypothetical protein